MKKKIIRVIVGIVVLNIVSYFLFSQMATEQLVNKEYVKFTDNRLKNKWVKDTTETIILASCGDEFFRDKKKFDLFVKNSSKRTTPYVLWQSDYHLEPMTELNKFTDSLKSNCSIVYKVCSQSTMHSLKKKVSFQYYYADSKTDYHIMYHNKQMELKAITYVWFLGFWIKIKEEKE
ncbi:hypothetical protein [Tenacibaculum sp. 190524A02b]|uniref:hypothetical protein n=1 Tax=Tenacibaculum vairaonense TaxID=3137860 RepID=UPI0031FA7314